MGRRDAPLVEIWTDGASTGRVGPGGWAYLVSTPEELYRLSGGFPSGQTNITMEMWAVIQALESLPPGRAIRVYCDLNMITKGMSQNWVRGWRSRGWVSARGKPVKNVPLWDSLQAVADQHKRITWRHVKGHTKSRSRAAKGNRIVDRMAQRARAQMSELVAA